MPSFSAKPKVFYASAHYYLVQVLSLNTCVDVFHRRKIRTLYPVPCTLYPVPCYLYPIPCTLYPVPCTLYPAPCTLHPVPCTLYSVLCTLYHVPCTLYTLCVYPVPCDPVHLKSPKQFLQRHPPWLSWDCVRQLDS